MRSLRLSRPGCEPGRWGPPHRAAGNGGSDDDAASAGSGGSGHDGRRPPAGPWRHLRVGRGRAERAGSALLAALGGAPGARRPRHLHRQPRTDGPRRPRPDHPGGQRRIPRPEPRAARRLRQLHHGERHPRRRLRQRHRAAAARPEPRRGRERRSRSQSGSLLSPPSNSLPALALASWMADSAAPPRRRGAPPARSPTSPSVAPSPTRRCCAPPARPVSPARRARAGRPPTRRRSASSTTR